MDAKVCRFCLYVVFVSLLSSCSSNNRVSNVIKSIHLDDCQVNEFTWQSCLNHNSRIISLQDSSKDFSFAEISKLVCRNDKIYILDWRTRRIISFDAEGNPLTVLNKRGRSDAEYLQISDFDVDGNGDYWILDGQKDAVIHYSDNGKFCAQHKTDGKQYSFITYIGEKLLLGLSQWDKSDNKFAIVDTNLTVISKCGIKPKHYDSNFSFPCCGFSSINETVQYNNPIDDNVSVVKGDEYLGEYYFDFGSKRVPDEIRDDVEPRLKELSNYTFLANVIGVFDDFVVGTLHEASGYADFVLDMKSKKIFKQPIAATGYHLTAICGDKVFLSGYDEDAGRTLLAYVSADSILESINE